MEIVVRATIAFAFIFLLFRLMGKKELSELSPFELILLVVIGDIVQQGVTQEDFSLVGSLLAAGTLGLITLFFSYLSYRSGRARRALEGIPVVIVRNGQILAKAMHIERLHEDEVRQAARKQGISDLADVEVGVLEPDGAISFIETSGSSPGGAAEKHKM